MRWFPTAAAIVLAAGGLATAAELPPEEDAMTSLSYISYLERYATVQPADRDETLEAVINMPLVSGDRIDTAREARMEVFLADGSTLWLDEYTSVSFDAVAFSRDGGGDRTVLYLAEGRLMIEVPDIDVPAEATRLDGPAGTVYLNRPGLYRVETLADGELHLEAWEGLAEVSTPTGGVLVRASSTARVGAGEVSQVQNAVTWHDDFAGWVEQRRQVWSGDSAQHVDVRYERQAAQLDNYGSWVYIDTTNSWAWQPSVGPEWRPYSYGRWYWTPVGWNWLSYEPWGWLPYHYGSWYYSTGYGWVWGWHPYWSPAWVSWVYWPGYVGWCPSGYYDHWYWHHYGGWYGWDHPHGGRPGYGGGHPDQPPRRSVQPPGDARDGSAVRRVMPDTPERTTLDLNGRVRLDALDRRPWNVVREGDFASPHLPRLMEPGTRAMPTDQPVEAIVRTGPLTTRSPSAARLENELDSAFRGTPSASGRDLSPVLARTDTLERSQAMGLVEPTSVAAVSRRAAPTTPRVTTPERSTTASGRTNAEGEGIWHRGGPNLYRPQAGVAAPSGGRVSVGTGSGGAPTWRSMPPGSSAIRPTSPNTILGRSSPAPATGSVRPPTVRYPSSARPVVPRSSGVTSRSPSSTSSPRPVIVPRTSRSAPSVGGSSSRPSYVRPSSPSSSRSRSSSSVRSSGSRSSHPSSASSRSSSSRSSSSKSSSAKRR